jgi:hypothetical protein
VLVNVRGARENARNVIIIEYFFMITCFFYCGAGAFSSGKVEVFRKNYLSPKITKDVTFKSLEEEGKYKKNLTLCVCYEFPNQESDRTPNHFEKI